MNNRRVGAAIAAVLTGTAVLAAGPANPVLAAGTNTTLAISSFGDMLVDGVHQRVFISDPAGGKVVMTDYLGNRLGAADVTGADDLALSADASRLYVGSPGESAISALDTGTLERTAKYSTGTVAPADVVVAGGRIWFSYTDGNGALGTIDPSTEAVLLDLLRTGSSAAELTTASARPDRIGLAAKGRTAVLDVSGDTVSEVASADTTAEATDVALTPDGTRIATANPGRVMVTVRDIGDFAASREHRPLHGRPRSVDIAPNGAVATTGDFSQLYLFAPSGGVIRSVGLATQGDGLAHGVAWEPNEDRLFVVSVVKGNAYALLTETNTRRAATSFSILDAPDVVPGGSVTVQGRLDSQLAMPAGTVVEVSRAGTSLGSFPIGSDDRFSFTDSPPGLGEVHYQISYGGAEFHLPATVSARLWIVKADVNLFYRAPETAFPETPIRIFGELKSSAPKPWPAGAVVEFSRNGIAVGAAPIDADGFFEFTDNPPGEGVMTYRLQYAGDAVRRSFDKKIRVQVSRLVSTVTLAGPLSSARGKSLTVTGVLASPLELPTGTTVSVSRTDVENPAGKSLGTRTVGADGSFSITDTPEIGGSVVYRVSYTGDAARVPASASWTVAVSRIKPTLTLTGNGKVYSYGKTVSFTARLGSTYQNRTVEIWADPAGDDQVRRLIKRAKVNSRGEVTAGIGLTRSATVTAVFTGDARYAPRTVSSMVNTRANITLKLSRYYKTKKISGKTYRYYRPSQIATFNVKIARASTRDVNIVLQRYTRGRWVTVNDAYFEAAYTIRLTASGLKGAKLRVKAGYEAGASNDAFNATTWTPYQYLIFK